MSGKYNNELEFYLRDNVQQENGKLVIYSKNQTVNTNQYTSGRLDTRNKFDFQYGQVEWRAKLPKGKGLWPALWLHGYHSIIPGYPPQEIDVMEARGDIPNKITVAVHYVQNNTFKSISGKFILQEGDFTTSYHNFKLIWEPNIIAFFVDNNPLLYMCNKDAIPKEKMYLLMNVAVGGDYPGNPDSTTVFPTKMLVDYVKVKSFKRKRRIEYSSQIHENTRLFKDLKSFFVISIDQCWKACEIYHDCQAASFNSRSFKCFFFASDYYVTNENGWLSYIKTCRIIKLKNKISN